MSCQKLRDELKAIRSGLEEVRNLLSAEAADPPGNKRAAEGETKTNFFDELTHPDELPEDEELFRKVLRLITDAGYASTIVLQHKLEVNYRQAASIVAELERSGLIGPAHGFRPHVVLPAAFAVLERLEESLEYQRG